MQNQKCLTSATFGYFNQLNKTVLEIYILGQHLSHLKFGSLTQQIFAI